MSGTGLLALSVAAYSVLPLLFAIRRTSFQFLLLYAHIASVLTLGGILGAVYVLPLYGDVALLAGQVSYGAFMFTTLITAIIGRDVQVVRNIVVLTLSVNVLVYLIFHVSNWALRSRSIANPLAIPPAVFDQSLSIVAVGGLVIIVELLALLVVLELTKERLGSVTMSAVYVLAFVAILTLDGVLFPTLVLRPSAGLGPLILNGVQAKLALAGAFSVPLVFFVVVYRPQVERFESTPVVLKDLLSLSRDPLLERLAATTEEAGRATATVARILDSATHTVLVATDQDLRITHFNRGAQQLLDYTEGEVIGQLPTIFYSDAELQAHAADLSTDIEPGEVMRAQVVSGEPRDWEYLARNGEVRTISLSVTEIRDDGRLIGYLAAGEDVTVRKETERCVVEALQREQAAVTRLEEADRVKDELVSTISHELRTPITSIRGYTELLSDGSFGDITEVQASALDKVERNTSRLQVLVEDLLFVARVDADELALDLVPLDLRAAVEASRDSLAQIIAQRPELQISYGLPAAPVTVFGDLASLERVVVNLCGNAIKFTPDGGTVTISLGQADGEAVLIVRDTGIGIAEHELDHVFRRFFRSEEANRLAIPGSGLGLDVARGIITKHGGSIEVASATGRGTTVTVRLASS